MTREEIERLKAIAEQRESAYQARRHGSPDSPSLPRFAELSRQARDAYNEARTQWERQPETALHGSETDGVSKKTVPLSRLSGLEEEFPAVQSSQEWMRRKE